MWDFQDVRCSGCGMFGMLDGIWDVDLQNASCSEIVSNFVSPIYLVILIQR